MNVLLIAPYKQSDGYGESARALISSILTTRIDLTLRPIYLAYTQQVDDELYTKLENKTQPYFDIVIQNCLPEYFVHYPGIKNIGFFCSETKGLEWTPWIPYIQLMDEIWVHSKIEKSNIEQNSVTTPVYNIGNAINIEKFKKTYVVGPKSNFTFYSIGNGYRKNFSSLILAFYREFDRNEPVELILKTNNIIDIDELKATYAIYKNLPQYKPINIINSYLSEEDMCKLHISSDCFVMPSFGEAWCRPAVDAMGFSKTPIVTSRTGMTDFINNNNGWVVDSIEIPTICNEKPISYLYTTRETWQQIDILKLQKAMREAYENKELKLLKAKQGIKDIEQYSYENIGKKIYDRLCS